MKLLFVFFSLLLISSIGYSQNVIAKQQNANSVLKKTSDKLNSLTTFIYEIRRELNYVSENYHNISEWSCYFNFDPTNLPGGFQYQVNDSTSSNLFNGTEKFELNKAAKTIQINNNPRKRDFNSLSYLYNSIVTLRNILPVLIADENSTKVVKDTTINNYPFEIVTINIGKRRIQNLGDAFDTMQTKYDLIYKITIDKINSFPTEVLQKNDLNNDFIKTNFSNINITPKQPAENSWYYSTYIPEYKPSMEKEMLQLIPIGSLAPDWTLPLYYKNENISLSDLKGKVILLDFWFKNCGPCIESIPHLNAINKKFKDKKFEILGINTWDAKKDVAWFCNKHQIAYTVLMNGKDIAEGYGVSAFPTLILIDKEGKVLYSGGFDQSKIEKLIEKAL